MQAFNKSSLSEFFEKYEFNNLQSKIESSNNKLSEKEKNTSVKNSYSTISNEKELIKIIDYNKKVGFVAIDTETDSIKPNNANLNRN